MYTILSTQFLHWHKRLYIYPSIKQFKVLLFIPNGIRMCVVHVRIYKNTSVLLCSDCSDVKRIGQSNVIYIKKTLLTKIKNITSLKQICLLSIYWFSPHILNSPLSQTGSVVEFLKKSCRHWSSLSWSLKKSNWNSSTWLIKRT